MRKLTSKHLFILLLLALAVFISACSSSEGSGETGEDTGNDSATAGTDEGVEQVLKINAVNEPPSIDPPLIDNRTAGEIANQLFEGLVRINENGEAVPGVAKEWEISDDGLVYTFYLNEDAKWSNGDQVTAEDFLYSWERSLRPETAAPLVSNLLFIKNAEAYNSGEITDPSEIGIKAIDETTFEITLERPTSFFLGLTAFFSVLPINKAVDESNPEWASEAETFVSNGPFKLESWDHGQELVMVPNENYWAADVVKLDEIRWVMVNDQNTEYGMYQAGEIDVSTNIPNNVKSELIESGEAGKLPAPRTYYIRFNNDSELFGNANIRRALGLALDRQLIVDQVTQGGEAPAYAFIPIGLGSGVGEFRELAGEALYENNDVEAAKQYLEEGLQELGLSSFPETPLLFQTDDTYNKLTQTMQEMWKQNLGIDIALQTMEQKVFIQTVSTGEYDVAIYSTGADYDDAINLMGQFTTDDIYNYSNISIPEYDDLMTKASEEVDLDQRAQYMVDAEKVLIDAMAISPLYYGTDVYLQKDNVKGIMRFPAQAIDYREAFKE